MQINNESYHSTVWARTRGRTLTSNTCIGKRHFRHFYSCFLLIISHFISVTMGTQKKTKDLGKQGLRSKISIVSYRDEKTDQSKMKSYQEKNHMWQFSNGQIHISGTVFNP